MHTSLALSVVVLACALALSSCATQHPALPTVDADCGAHAPVARPGSIRLGCADGSLDVEQISWQSYGRASATGMAVVRAETCRPNCAEGGVGSYPATVTLTGVAVAEFRTLTLHYAGAGPDGRRVATYPIQ